MAKQKFGFVLSTNTPKIIFLDQRTALEYAWIIIDGKEYFFSDGDRLIVIGKNKRRITIYKIPIY